MEGGGRTKVGTKVRRIYPAIFAESNRSPPKRFTFASESRSRVSRRDLLGFRLEECNF